MDLKKIAKSLPYPLQKIIKYIYGAVPPRFRYGRVFWDTYNFLQQSQWWSKEKLEEYQMEQLGRLLNHAYKNVPYYQRVFNERGLTPKDIQCLGDLEKLPYLTKDTARENYRNLTSKNFRLETLSVSHTSGTTGKPLQWYISDTEIQKESAFIFHQWSRVGIKPGDSMIQLRGSIISNKRLIDYDPITRVLRLSPKIDTKEVATYYIKRIQEFKARLLHGYPSAISIFAFMIKKHKLHVPFELKTILFASEEAVYQWEREIIEEVFGSRVFDFYGLSEKVVLAGECEKSNNYHCIPQYGITEIDNKTNEIIGTSFINYVTPFIRYRTTDIAAGEIKSNCNECGRNYFPIFNSVEGRIEDFIITPKGGCISPIVVGSPLKYFKTIKNTQIVQESLNLIRVNVVPWKNYSKILFDKEMQNLCMSLQKIIGSNVEIRINIVDKIKLSKSGKFRRVVSKISKDSLLKGMN